MENHNRRAFVKRVGAAAMSFALAPNLLAATEGKEKPLVKKSLKFGMIKEDLSILDKFKLIKDLGL